MSFLHSTSKSISFSRAFAIRSRNPPGLQSRIRVEIHCIYAGAEQISPCSSCCGRCSVPDDRHERMNGEKLTMGKTQHLACWPMAAQMETKSFTDVGVFGAVSGNLAKTHHALGSNRKRTRCTVEIGNAQNIRGTTQGVAIRACANRSLARRQFRNGQRHGGCHAR